MSASARANRRGDSMITRLAGTAASSCSALRRATCRGGRNPANMKRSVGNPDTTSAASTDDGPGTAHTGSPSSMQARTSLYPGSEINGVPASAIKATVSPRFRRSMSSGAHLGGVVFVVGGEPRRDFVDGHQLGAHPRVLAGDHIRRTEDFEGAA